VGEFRSRPGGFPMLRVTFPKGMSSRHVIKWMIRRHDNNAATDIRTGQLRKLSKDLVYSDDVDWLKTAHETAFAFGLVLYQDERDKRWKLRKMLWSKRDYLKTW
jgi:hypothetical protein